MPETYLERLVNMDDFWVGTAISFAWSCHLCHEQYLPESNYYALQDEGFCHIFDTDCVNDLLTRGILTKLTPGKNSRSKL